MSTSTIPGSWRWNPTAIFEIRDALTPLPPSPCTNPVLLILNAGGSWFAAGIPKL